MSKQAFVYSGPVASVSLKGVRTPGVRNRGASQDVLLSPGHVVELPPEHPYVQRLQARGFLVPAPSEASALVPSPTPALAPSPLTLAPISEAQAPAAGDADKTNKNDRHRPRRPVSNEETS